MAGSLPKNRNEKVTTTAARAKKKLALVFDAGDAAGTSCVLGIEASDFKAASFVEFSFTHHLSLHRCTIAHMLVAWALDCSSSMASEQVHSTSCLSLWD